MLGRHLTRGIAWVLLGMGLARPSGAVDTILVHGHVFTGKGNWAESSILICICYSAPWSCTG
jgi:hypothetical protein